MTGGKGDSLASSFVLLRKAKAGDTDALDQLFRRYASRVLQIVRLRLGHGLRAKLGSQDIVQGALIRALKGFERFEVRQESGFLHWLSELVENEIRDQGRFHNAQKRAIENEVHLSAQTTTTAWTLPGKDKTPSEIAVLQEDFAKLEAAMDDLPEEYRSVIFSRDVDGMSFLEIGKATQKSEDAARMFYARAKTRLVTLMEGA